MIKKTAITDVISVDLSTRVEQPIRLQAGRWLKLWSRVRNKSLRQGGKRIT
jgi:hypothetical protein